MAKWSKEEYSQFRRDEYKALSPEKKLALSRKQYLAIKSDPQKHAHRLAKIRAARKARHEADPTHRLKSALRARLSKVLAGKKSSTLGQLMGCGPKSLKSHLERQFRGGMTWDNYGTYWHIDHITPCSHFDHNAPEQVAKCWHYTNLQPLTATENCSKQDRWIG